MVNLPSLRRRIFRSFLTLVLIYGVLGLFLTFAALLAGRNTPKVIHQNYDSISALIRMDQAWDALRFPEEYSQKAREQWIQQFEDALRFEEKNVTEPGEKESSQEIREVWDRHRKSVTGLDVSSGNLMRERIHHLIKLNEQGMFTLAQENTQLSRMILMGSVVFFLISLILTIFLGDGLAVRLSTPLHNLAEVLRSKPKLGRKLRLPDPADLELLILNQELASLWDRVNEVESLNVREIVQEKAKLETVLESVEDSLLVIDSAGRVTHCNRLLLKLIGLDSSQVIGQLWRDLPTNNEGYLKLRAALRDEMPDSLEIDLCPDGQKCFYAARFRKIQGADGKVAATLFLLHDITERRQRDRLRNDLINILSHELKTPLQSLGTASDLFVQYRHQLPEDLKLLVDTVAEDVERIRAVAGEFVQITQTHSKVLRLKLDRVVMSELIDEWLKPFRVVARDRGVQLELEREGSSVIWARVDRVKFPWVISNLVSNAIRFSSKGSAVRVKITDRNKAVEIQVKDSGPGIPLEDRERIFEPFFQAKTPAWDGARGLFGVGLTIAKEVVEAHDGRIEYYPNEPQGSVFRILLPFPEGEVG